MKKLIAATTALALCLCLAPAYLYTADNAAADDSAPTVYPTEFLSQLEFENLADYDFNGDTQAFADNASAGAVLYIVEPDEYGDSRLTEVSCSFTISDIEYGDNGTLYLMSSDNSIYSYTEAGISAAIHIFASQPNTLTDSNTGYMYLYAQSGSSFAVMAFNGSTPTNIFDSNCSQFKKIDDTVYVLHDNAVYSLYEDSAIPVECSYIDLTAADNISTGNAAEVLQGEYDISMVTVHPQTNDGNPTYVTKIDLTELGATFKADGTERLLADRTGMALAEVGNATIVLMTDEEGESSCYLTLTSAVENASYTPPENDMTRAYARGQAAIYSRPYACDATAINSVPNGTLLTVSEKADSELLDDVFYKVSCTVDGQEIEGYAIGRSLSAYTFSAEDDVEHSSGTESFAYGSDMQTVIIILIIVLLVLIAIGYVTFYATKKNDVKNRSNKKSVPPSDDDLYMQ